MEKLIDNYTKADLFEIPEDEEEPAFNLNNILDYMHQKNWKWCSEIVDRKMFIEEVNSLCQNVVESLLEQINDNPDYNLEDQNFKALSETGGIEVYGFLNSDSEIELTVKFIIEESTTFIPLKEILNVYDK